MSIAFKEWALVCEALGRGEQSIIIRKGGIAEGRAGFRFQHPEFLLFPTLFHEQAAKLRLPAGAVVPAAAEDGMITVRWRAEVEWTRDLADWSVVQRLEPFHCWQEAEIEKRFRQDEQPGVSLAFVRIFRLAEPFTFPNQPAYGGCRSWVKVSDLPPDAAFEPVLDNSAHRAREAGILQALGK